MTTAFHALLPRVPSSMVSNIHKKVLTKYFPSIIYYILYIVVDAFLLFSTSIIDYVLYCSVLTHR